MDLSPRQRCIAYPVWLSKARWLVLLAASLGVVAGEPIRAQDDYRLLRIGLFDAEHTAGDGFQISTVSALDGGFAAGVSRRFFGEDIFHSLGQSAWVTSAGSGQTMRIGFTDAAHTSGTGWKASEIAGVTSDGFVLGKSSRYGVGDGTGGSAWVANASTGVTTEIGLVGAGYTRPNGERSSAVEFSGGGGFVAGTSSRYDGNSGNGQAAWVAESATGATTRIGFFNAAHTGSDGAQVTRLTAFSETGYVGGISMGYAGGNNFVGQSAWVFSIATGQTTRLGFTGPGYQDYTGAESSSVTALNATGFVGGTSGHYSGLIDLGSVAWVAPVSTGVPTRVGLTDATHTNSDGYQFNNLTHLGSRYAGGTANRYDNAFFPGQSAWVASLATGVTTEVGIFDAEHRGSDGRQNHRVEALNSTHAAGYSDRFSGTDSIGQSAWVFSLDVGSIANVGLTDARHTSAFGDRTSYLGKLTESGYVAGFSWRFNEAGIAGQTAWIYHIPTGTRAFFDLSERADHFAFSFIRDITEAGVAIGEYERFSQGGGSMGQRAFAWTPARGFFDLGDALAGGLPANWDSLPSGLFADRAGNLAGEGILGAGSVRGTYLATPTPEPGTTLSILVGTMALCARRRRSGTETPGVRRAENRCAGT